MEWREVSPGIHVATYEEYTITRLTEGKDIYQKQYFEYVAVKGNDKINRDNIEDVKALIHSRAQKTLF